MSMDDVVPDTGGLTRRQILERGAVLGLTIGGAAGMAADLASAATPKRGGTLRVGLIGGSPNRDNLDPHLEGSSQLSQSYRQNVYSKLTDMAPNGSFVNQLAESFTANKDATVWQIKIKRGVDFHDGSELTVDDVIYTFQRILDTKNNLNAARGNIDMIDPAGMRKINKYTMTVRLTRPWSDFPTAVGQRYINIMKRGTTGPYTVENANGTGPFKVTSWKAGESFSYVANRNYFENGKPYLNGIQVQAFPDPVARVNALIANQVDCICDVPAAQAAVIRQRGLNLIVNPGGNWTPIVMNTNAPPFTDVRVREAMKLVVDRKKAVAAALGGFGSVGNDLFGRHDPLYAKQIPQRPYDPEKARRLMQQAGALNTPITLRTSDANSDMVPLALVFEQGAKAAGMNINVVKDPADTFWSNTWGVAPFTFSSWGYRPFFPQWLQSFVSFNAQETRWNDKYQKQASRLVYKAAATADVKRQKALALQAQRLHWQYGGYVIPYFRQTLDAANK
ncbi:MAG: ABC transporter substrate-binding protein, partial [Thermoleophilia bacterium]|nr:ABC transporter substrate-binding protein [Thermoleophilia bacterium]